jgi:hypothetical protein
VSSNAIHSRKTVIHNYTCVWSVSHRGLVWPAQGSGSAGTAKSICCWEARMSCVGACLRGEQGNTNLLIVCSASLGLPCWYIIGGELLQVPLGPSACTVRTQLRSDASSPWHQYPRSLQGMHGGISVTPRCACGMLQRARCTWMVFFCNLARSCVLLTSTANTQQGSRHGPVHIWCLHKGSASHRPTACRHCHRQPCPNTDAIHPSISRASRF